MRVLVIAPEQLPVPPIKGGSVESCIYNIFSRMAESTQVTILSRAHPKLPAVSSHGRLKIIRIPIGNRSDYIRAALQKVRGKSFDVVQVENRPTFVPQVKKAFPRAKIVLSLHSLYFMSQLSGKQAHNVLSKVNNVVSVVNFVSDTFKNKYPKYAHKFRSAILGVDTNKFKPYTLQQKLVLRRKWNCPNSYNLLFVGRIVPKKGLDTLVKAAAIVRKHHPNTKIIAVGASWPGVSKETAYMRKTRRLAKRLNVPIQFTGYIPPSRVHEMYQLANLFVCPTKYKEGFATVNSEAMASGIPVIASKSGGITEVVKHGSSGLLVSNYTNPKAFANAILKLMNNPELAKKLTRNGRERAVQHFSWYNTVNRLKGIYRG